MQIQINIEERITKQQFLAVVGAYIEQNFGDDWIEIYTNILKQLEKNIKVDNTINNSSKEVEDNKVISNTNINNNENTTDNQNINNTKEAIVEEKVIDEFENNNLINKSFNEENKPIKQNTLSFEEPTNWDNDEENKKPIHDTPWFDNDFDNDEDVLQSSLDKEKSITNTESIEQESTLEEDYEIVIETITDEFGDTIQKEVKKPKSNQLIKNIDDGLKTSVAYEMNEWEGL